MKHQQMSRRDFLKYAAWATAGASLAACTPAAAPTPVPPPADTQAPPPTAAPTAVPTPAFPVTAPSASGTLTIWGWEGTFEGVQSQIPAFNKIYANLKVDIKTLGYDDTHTNMINATIAGTGAPDICFIDLPYLAKMADGLVDLLPVTAQYKDLFVPPNFTAGSIGGKQYGIPTDSEPMGVFYRKDLWDQYGLKEEAIETWDDLIAAGNALDAATSGKVKLYHMNSDMDEVFWMMVVEQGFAGVYFSPDDKAIVVDDPKFIEAATVLKRMWDAKGVQKNPVGGSYADECTKLLKNGNLACQVAAAAWYPVILTGQMPELSGKWRLMRAPAMSKGGSRAPYFLPSLAVMSQQSKLQGAAWDLMKMGLLGDGAKALYDKTKILPAYQPLLDSIKNDKDPYFGDQQVNLLWDQIAPQCPPMSYGTGLDEARKIMGTHLNDLLTGTKSPEQAMKEAAQEMRTKLKKA